MALLVAGTLNRVDTTLGAGLAGDGEGGLTLGLLTLSELVVVDVRHVDGRSNRMVGRYKV